MTSATEHFTDRFLNEQGSPEKAKELAESIVNEIENNLELYLPKECQDCGKRFEEGGYCPNCESGKIRRLDL